MQYRPHIDGLRTVAIVPVVLYHLGVSIVPGGFVGVDVFFVISGYLITNVLLGDLERGRFSIARFYQRRVLRIFPALFIMLAAVWITSSFVYFPGELESIGWQVLTAATFVSNFYFWTDSGYFTAAAETQPLLHTWSLAVEEQFYLLFPILLFLVFKLARKRATLILALFSIASLIACIALTYRHQPTAFFLLPTRAWELGAGAMLSIIGAKLAPNRGRTSLAVIGILLIAVPMASLQPEQPPFPGWAAVFPVVGAALLIGYGEGTVIGKALSWRPIVYIGKVSFSVYLWHWPLIVFWKAVNGPDLSAWEMLALGAASFVCGVLSTEFVERPFRTARARGLRPARVLAVGTAGLIVVAAMGATQAIAPVSLVPASASTLRAAAAADYRETSDYQEQFRTGTCLIGQADGGADAFDAATCATPDSARTNIVLLGDSHAAQFWGALAEEFPQANTMQVTSSGCRPLVDAPGQKRCTDLREWAYDEFLPETPVDVIVLGGRWEESELALVPATIERLKSLADEVIVMGPTVEYDGTFPTLLARGEALSGGFLPEEHLTPGRDTVNERMRSITETEGVTYVDVLNTICPATAKCVSYAPDGIPMQFDYGHLTLSGSRFVIDSNRELLSQVIDAQ